MTRAAVLQLFHEANAFSPAVVSVRDFHSRQHVSGPIVRELYGHTQNWLGGVLEALEDAGCETEIGLCTACLPGGPLDRQGYDILVAEMLHSLDAILDQGPVDVVCLLLHGALIVQGLSEPEGRIAVAVRNRVGPTTVIGVTLDFHANINPSLAENADILVGGQLYPHTDTRKRGRDMVSLALRRRAGEPLQSVVASFPISTPMPNQTTVSGPFAELLALGAEIEKQYGLADLTVMGGFPYSTVAQAVTSLIITGRMPEDRDAVIPATRDMAAAIYDRSAALRARVAGQEDVMADLRDRLRTGRVVLADVGDNPGGGGLGDTTILLSALVDLGEPFVFGALVAPALVQDCIGAGAGGRVTIPPTGETGHHPVMTGAVVSTGPCQYRNLGPMMNGELVDGGLSAVIRVGAGHVLAVTERIQAYDTNAFLSLGLDLDAARIIAIKSSAHFRASYTPLATGGIIVADSGGYSAVNPENFPPAARSRPVMPFCDVSRERWDGVVALELDRLYRTMSTASDGPITR